jgi:hypothetical protein
MGGEVTIAIILIGILILWYFLDKTDQWELGIEYATEWLEIRQKRGENNNYKKKKFIFTSKTEIECRKIVESIFQKPFPKVRPFFLKNPRTGKNLELDMYNDDLKLAIEVDGPQHHQYNPYFHKNIDDFRYQLEKDQIKNKKCDELGITLLRIPYRIKDKEAYLKEHLTRLGFL